MASTDKSKNLAAPLKTPILVPLTALRFRDPKFRKAHGIDDDDLKDCPGLTELLANPRIYDIPVYVQMPTSTKPSSHTTPSDTFVKLDANERLRTLKVSPNLIERLVAYGGGMSDVKIDTPRWKREQETIRLRRSFKPTEQRKRQMAGLQSADYKLKASTIASESDTGVAVHSEKAVSDQLMMHILAPVNDALQSMADIDGSQKGLAEGTVDTSAGSLNYNTLHAGTEKRPAAFPLWTPNMSSRSAGMADYELHLNAHVAKRPAALIEMKSFWSYSLGVLLPLMNGRVLAPPVPGVQGGGAPDGDVMWMKDGPDIKKTNNEGVAVDLLIQLAGERKMCDKSSPITLVLTGAVLLACLWTGPQEMTFSPLTLMHGRERSRPERAIEIVIGASLLGRDYYKLKVEGEADESVLQSLIDNVCPPEERMTYNGNDGFIKYSQDKQLFTGPEWENTQLFLKSAAGKR